MHNVIRYILTVIRNFACKETEKLFDDEVSRKMPAEIQRIARRKLLMLHQVRNILDLRVPPANFLEKLKGDRKGQYSIRINRQWRICFSWREGHIWDVEIVDYH